MMKKYIFSLFCFITSQAQEFKISLPTEEKSIQTVYLSSTSLHMTPYEKSLYEALLFDFNHNGKTRTLNQTEAAEEFLHTKPEVEAFQNSFWKPLNARFVIFLKIEESKLSCKCFDINSATIKSLHAIPLTNDLLQDINSMHKIHDALFFALFQEQSICSKKILYSHQENISSKDREEWKSEIWETDFTGRHSKQITFENSYSITPTCLPSLHHDDYQFAYVCYKLGQPKIHFKSNQNPKSTPLISLKGNQLLPSFSMQGDQIAFVSDASGRADLFIQSFDQKKGPLHKPIQIFSKPGAVQASPSFSPDGKKLAFVSDMQGSPQLFVINIDEARKNHKMPEASPIPTEGRDNTTPSWSNDGKYILFSSRINGVHQIACYDIEAKEQKILTVGQENKENPRFAPNNLHIIYNTTSPTFDLYMIHLNDPTPIKLTQNKGINHYPVWQQ